MLLCRVLRWVRSKGFLKFSSLVSDALYPLDGFQVQPFDPTAVLQSIALDQPSGALPAHDPEHIVLAAPFARQSYASAYCKVEFPPFSISDTEALRGRCSDTKTDRLLCAAQPRPTARVAR